MKLSVEVKTSRYKFLWLKYVTAFNPAEHCARGLIGKYDPAFRFAFGKPIQPGTTTTAMEGLDVAPFAYLCGVTSRWSENLHVAFRAKPGACIAFEDGNAVVRIDGAERVEIPQAPPEWTEGRSKDFTTCRNWQFGVAYLADGLSPNEGRKAGSVQRGLRF